MISVLLWLNYVVCKHLIVDEILKNFENEIEDIPGLLICKFVCRYRTATGNNESLTCTNLPPFDPLCVRDKKF